MKELRREMNNIKRDRPGNIGNIGRTARCNMGGGIGRGKVIVVAAGFALLAGCGGSGVNTNPNATGLASGGSRLGSDRTATGTDAAAKAEAERGRFGVFVTVTGAATGYDRFWADIRKIELIDADEKSATVYEGDDFVTDLTQLGDERAPRFALVGVGVVPTEKSYARARVTFGKAFSLLPSGAQATLSLPVSDAVGRDAADNPQITLPLERPRDFGNGKQNLVLAFDLSKTIIKDGRVTPALKEGKTDGLNEPGRQAATTFLGEIRDLHFGEKETTFALGIGPNRSVTVMAGDATSYANATSAPNPTLKEGYKVAVRGTLNPETKRVTARSVEIFGETAPPVETATVRGALEGTDAQSLTVTVAPDQVSNLTPTARAVVAQLAADAVLRGPGGLLLTSEQFFDAAKAKGSRVTLEGTYEPVTATFRALRARIADPDNVPAVAALIEGTPKKAAIEDGKLMVADLTAWQGVLARSEGKGVSVVASPATLFFDEKGEPLTATSFYAALKEADHAVRVIGLYTNGTLGATRATLLPPAPKPDPKLAEAKKGEKGDTKDADPKAAKSKSDAPESKDGEPAKEKPAEEPKPGATDPDDEKPADEKPVEDPKPAPTPAPPAPPAGNPPAA